MKKRGREAQNVNPTKKILQSAGVGVLTGIAVILLLLVLLSVIFKISGSISPTASGICTVVVAAVAGFCGGYTATRILKKSGLAVGLLTALALCALLFLVGVLLSENQVQTTSLIKHGILIAGGCTGGVLGVNHREKHH